MPDVPYAQTVRVVVSGVYLSETFSNTWHLRVSGAFVLDITTATAIADAFQDFYLNAETSSPPGIGTYRPNQAIVTRINVYDLRTVPNPVPIEFVTALPGTGGATGVLPVDAACVISLRTATAGASGRGRIFLGPLHANAMAAATATTPPGWSSTFRTDIVDAVLALDAALSTAVGVASNAIAVLSVTDGVSRAVAGIRIDGRPDTQRRRDLDLAFDTTSAAIP